MPAERTKKTKTPESVPEQGHPDRKRVLNVLAQRRYRQRRREKTAALEAQATTRTTSGETQDAVSIEQQVTTSSETGLGNSDMFIEAAQSPSVDDLGAFNFEHELLALDFTQEYAFPNLSSSMPSTSSSPPLHFPLTPEGALLNLPILNALRAFASVAIAFDVVAHIWDPAYLHIVPPCSPAVAALPANLHPVAAQLTIPHHPVLDMLPWPSVREKLICMLSMPSSFRPPVAREQGDGVSIASFDGDIKQSTAIVQLTQDLDDMQDGGGIRVHGDSFTCELHEDAWEIGDVFYKKWWWCLDQRVISVSNSRRRERGLPRLKALA